MIDILGSIPQIFFKHLVIFVSQKSRIDLKLSFFQDLSTLIEQWVITDHGMER